MQTGEYEMRLVPGDAQILRFPERRRADPAQSFLSELADQHMNAIEADRVAVIVAHPDDESVGIAGQLPRMRGVNIVHVTDGAPREMEFARYRGFDTREAYAKARNSELDAALDLAGVHPAARIKLNVIDQEVAQNLVPTTHRLVSLFLRANIELVVTHPYEGGHPDHDGTAFCVHSACRYMSRHGLRPPAIVEMASYFEGEAGGVYQEFVPSPKTTEVVAPLSPSQSALKQAMLDAHKSQASTLYLFQVWEERFRKAPAYDFAELPNAGRLHYATFKSGMEGDCWIALARSAMTELEISALSA